jgi:alpha-L-arabinofuranosidase
MNYIKIDLERVLSDIDRNIFGGYLENKVYGGIYSPDSPLADKDGLRSDIRAALERMRMPNIRFPGGNLASGYRWLDGVGPKAERPVRHDLAWNAIVSNQFGTDEFMQFCRKMHIEPYLCANAGDGNIREAADWVEYCNGAGDSALVKMRRKNGFDAPYKVKYWGIGNEVDGPWQIGYKTPQEYARAITEFSKVMKRVDPDIRLIAAAVSIWEDYPFSDFPGWKTEWVERTQLMLEQAGDRIDYMALHRYAHLNNDDPFESFMAFSEDFNQRLTAYEGLISSVSLERGIRHNISIAIDEWAVMRMPVRKDRLITNFLEDALVVALHLNAFIRHARSVRLANFTSMMTAIGINYPNLERLEKPVLFNTIFYPFELYSRTCGQLALDVFWDSDTYSGAYLGHTYTGVRTLDVTATLDVSKKQLVVYVINQSKDKAMETTIALTGGEFTGNAKVTVVNGPDIKSGNTEENPYQVVAQQMALKALGKSFSYTFEPHSITALVCAVN